VLAIAIAIGLSFPASSSAADCEGASCGVPDCWEPSVRLRPDLTRAVLVSCRGATSARLIKAPGHSDVTNVTADWYGLRFEGRPHEGAPRFDEAVFELTGHGGSVELKVRIEVVPTSENSPPICWGDRVSQRSDGTGPVSLYMHPYCHDPDGDDFVMEGGPPGVHSSSPKKVPAGSSESNWPYMTATFAGDETATLWATDVLGARSQDAELRVTVGPDVDRLPYCRPSSYSAGEVIAVHTRPGKIRRFGLICTDADADLFASVLSGPPARGALGLLETDPQYGYWGVERWSDATYVPLDDSMEPDPFSVTAIGTRGAGPAGRMAMVPRALPRNGGGGCGWWTPTDVISPGPGLLRIGCSDDEGDDFSVEILTKPQHGTIAPAAITPELYGYSAITIPYVPDLGYEGYDCVEVRVTDGNGLVFKMSFDIWVKPPVKLPDLPLPELPDPPEPPELPDPPDPQPELPLSPDPPADPDPPVSDEPEASPPPTDESRREPDSPQLTVPTEPLPDRPEPEFPEFLEPLLPHLPPALEAPTLPTAPLEPGQLVEPPLPTTSTGTGGPPPPVQPPVVDPAAVPAGESVRSVVERILGTRKVKRVHRAGGAEVWTRSKLSRRTLLNDGQAPGVVVVCEKRCRVRADAELAIGAHAIRSSRRKTAAAVMPEQPHVLSLTLGPADQRALRSARRPRARFSLSVRPDGASPKSVKRSIPVSR
jgi:hypothetical protein